MGCKYLNWRYDWNEDKEFYCEMTGAGCCPPTSEDGIYKCSKSHDKEFEEQYGIENEK